LFYECHVLDYLISLAVIAIPEPLISGYLGIAMALFALMLLANRLGIRRLEVYWLLGFFLWWAMLYSGVHATIAGVLIACTIPFSKSRGHKIAEEPLMVAEHALRPAVQSFIMPLYAVVAAGFAFEGIGVDSLTHPVSLGVFLGLFIGKPVGILGFAFLFQWLSGSKLHMPWGKLAGAACLAGIGFTMSLFIGNIAFGADGVMGEYVRVGVFAGSILSGILGCLILDKSLPKRGHKHAPSPAVPFLTKD
jgi:NhaA family Na+:H+ antiporter